MGKVRFDKLVRRDDCRPFVWPEKRPEPAERQPGSPPVRDLDPPQGLSLEGLEGAVRAFAEGFRRNAAGNWVLKPGGGVTLTLIPLPQRAAWGWCMRLKPGVRKPQRSPRNYATAAAALLGLWDAFNASAKGEGGNSAQDR